jgi:peptidoglycan/LPS O-acetylase OafA/YrhL
MNSANLEISSSDQHYINIMRGISILRVVLVHLGLSWFYPPYSQYVGIFLPVLFFVSGAVSYYSFLRSKTVIVYLVKRLTLILVPFYVFAVFVLLITAIFYRELLPDFNGILRWILIWPRFGEVFFPINQVWYINALVLMILFSWPIFALSRERGWPIWLVITGCFFLSLLNAFHPIYENFISSYALSGTGYGYQLWQILILLGIFLYGAVHYRYFASHSRRFFALGATVFLLLAISTFFYFEFPFEMSSHREKRSIYFLFLSMFGIYLFLALQNPVQNLLKAIPYAERLILHFNKYAYSIFLLHTLVLFLVEKRFGLDNLSDQLGLALLRMFLVVVVTAILAKPLGDFSKHIANKIRGKILTGTSRSTPNISSEINK